MTVEEGDTSPMIIGGCSTGTAIAPCERHPLRRAHVRTMPFSVRPASALIAHRNAATATRRPAAAAADPSGQSAVRMVPSARW